LIVLIFVSKYAISLGNDDTHFRLLHLDDLIALGSEQVGSEQQKRFFHITVIESSAINVCDLINANVGSLLQ